MNRTLEHLRHATRIFMVRHRVIRWVPLAEPTPAFVPEWLRRGAVVKDMTRSLA
jgi:hypothetical protein